MTASSRAVKMNHGTTTVQETREQSAQIRENWTVKVARRADPEKKGAQGKLKDLRKAIGRVKKKKKKQPI